MRKLGEKCPTCGTVHSAGSLRFDEAGDIRCPACVDDGGDDE